MIKGDDFQGDKTGRLQQLAMVLWRLEDMYRDRETEEESGEL